ncbi:Phosphoglycerate mutase-like protein 1, partial [Cucurbita argyrosperma subsp. argyrosperma]
MAGCGHSRMEERCLRLAMHPTTVLSELQVIWKCFVNEHSIIYSERRIIQFGFTNCELRSMVIVDKSMKGSDPSRTNYPGKIPQGLDLPSDAATEKHPEKGATGNAVA